MIECRHRGIGVDLNIRNLIISSVAALHCCLHQNTFSILVFVCGSVKNSLLFAFHGNPCPSSRQNQEENGPIDNPFVEQH